MCDLGIGQWSNNLTEAAQWELVNFVHLEVEVFKILTDSWNTLQLIEGQIQLDQ